MDRCIRREAEARNVGHATVRLSSSRLGIWTCSGGGRKGVKDCCTSRHDANSASVRRACNGQLRPWHFLYFLPEPHGHGSLRPTFPKLGVGVAGWEPRCWLTRQALRISTQAAIRLGAFSVSSSISSSGRPLSPWLILVSVIRPASA